MAMTDKIRAEIERRKKYQLEQFNKKKPDGRPNDGWTESLAIMGELEELLSFLDTLEEQECPEYCVRSHCIGCSKYNPDEWSNKPRKARVKATGEIVEGFTDGQGHFDVFTDHNICNRYDVSAVEFDPLEEPVSKDLEDELDRFIASGESVTVDDYGTYKVSYHDFKKVAHHFAEWGAEHLRDSTKKVSEGVEEVAEEYRRESYRKSIVPNIDGPMPEYGGSIKDSFKAGAEWQKAKMISALKNYEDLPIEFIDKFYEIDRTAFQDGQVNMKEQMMEGAVEGEVVKDISNKLAVTAKNINLDGLKFGDKVRIIILPKEDEK